MKLVLVASLAAVLGLGTSGKAEAHGYGPSVGGSFYWADDGVVVGLKYGRPYLKTHYVTPRYGYRPRAYRHAYRHAYPYAYRHGKHHGRHYGHRKAYRKGYGKGHHKGYYKGYRHGHRHSRYCRH